MRTAASYLRLLKGLLPKGRAWNKNDTIMEGMLAAESEELARVDARMTDLIRERDTRTADEMITDHETEFGITEPKVALSARQTDANNKLKEIGGMRPSYYIAQALNLGYTISVEEFTPSWAGQARAGDPCGEQDIMFYWRVNILYDPTNPDFEYDIDKLYTLFEMRKPAHTQIVYTVSQDLSTTGHGFDSGFDSGFERFLG